jgi:hypothetical protein
VSSHYRSSRKEQPDIIIFASALNR